MSHVADLATCDKCALTFRTRVGLHIEWKDPGQGTLYNIISYFGNFTVKKVVKIHLKIRWKIGIPACAVKLNEALSCISFGIFSGNGHTNAGRSV